VVEREERWSKRGVMKLRRQMSFSSESSEERGGKRLRGGNGQTGRERAENGRGEKEGKSGGTPQILQRSSEI